MRRYHLAAILAPIFVGACATSNPDKHTLAELRNLPPDTKDVRVEDGLETAMQSYQRFLNETPETILTAEAMRRLADLKIEKEYGILGDGELVELPAPEAGDVPDRRAVLQARRPSTAGGQQNSESDAEFEKRATQQYSLAASEGSLETQWPEDASAQLAQTGPVEAIALYDQILAKYPSYEHADQVLYQKARAYDELGRTGEAIATIDRLITEHPRSKYLDEVQFRRAEHFFVRRKFRDAEAAYSAITDRGAASEYYELALYKLGWTLYKQDFYEEALHKYMALLDYKVSVGYDFDQKHEEENERRIADTFHVISLSFSNLGGPPIVREYFTEQGNRAYEDRVYRNLGEFYRGKLRYQDAASAYQAFVDLYPFHRASPHFSMRVIEIYEEGSFPKLVLDSKKAFAGQYGVRSAYWQRFEIAESPEVVAYLKRNLTDLANHYHAKYQDKSLLKEKSANYAEASLWYREFLTSFDKDPQAPGVNYQLADLLLENQDYAGAAKEYERTAYDYEPHEKAPAAGYAAIYAHRENLKTVSAEDTAPRRDTVASSLKFADTFPDHEHAAVVLGAAADDLYAIKDFNPALDAARKLIERYPGAAAAIRRSAWIVVAHASFDLADYPSAEQAYVQVIAMTAADDQSRPSLVENLAASIYKQGEQANGLQDYRTAASHFLRIKQAAPSASIRPAAEYDAGAALVNLKDWPAAAEVFEAFRRAYPEHELQREATKQIAYISREAGQMSRAADEYERVASESDDPQLRSEALLLAGDLHEQAGNPHRAVESYGKYVIEFPKPVELAVETRFKIAGIHKKQGAEPQYKEQLNAIVEADAQAGSERTDRTRYLAARASLELSEELYRSFVELQLKQPFEKSLQQKQARMDEAIKAFGDLVAYEVGEVTAAATFYMAEIYSGFSRALIESERPAITGPQLQEYESTLEEEAFPFEEKAIEVHEKNLELLSGGIYNAWIDKSLVRLAELKPGRYAKAEISSGFLGSVDRYAYRRPALQVIAPAPVSDEAPAEVPVQTTQIDTAAIEGGANAAAH